MVYENFDIMPEIEDDEEEDEEDDEYSEEAIAERKALRRELLPKRKKPYFPPYDD